MSLAVLCKECGLKVSNELASIFIEVLVIFLEPAVRVLCEGSTAPDVAAVIHIECVIMVNNGAVLRAFADNE